MKKLLSLSLALLMLFGCMSTAFAASESATVYVTVSNKGELAVAQQKVTVKDIDGDNVLTVNDALYAVHKAKYKGGADAGYSYYIHKDYGLSLGKLWGDSSGNFGYYLNNSSCWSLADTVKNGDYLNAFVYSDGKYFSDIYCFFEANTVSAEKGEEIALTLKGAGYDASWNPVTVPVKGATITVNGEKTAIKTDANGNATISIEKNGTYVISAVSSTQTLVPPVCTAKIGSFDILALISSIISMIINAIGSLVSSFIK